MSTVTIGRDVNFKDIEELNKNIVGGSNIALRIPTTLNTSGAFGIEGLVVQLISTWLRTEGTHVLHLFVQDPVNEDSFSDLCNSLYGIFALSLSDKIISAQKTPIERRLSLLTAVDRFNKIREESFTRAFKGFYLTIPSIKAPGNNSEINSPFYNGDKVVGRAKFLQITKNALESVVPNENYHLQDSTVSNLSEILRELFTNTHKHARKDEYGNIIDRNIRSVSFRSALINNERLIELQKSGGKNLVMFMGEWLTKDKSSISILDITVVDSGPGYARRWTGLSREKLDFEKECDAVVDCFEKYKSSDKSESSGSGLSNVLRDLKSLRGWFRLRTGSTQIERSFYDKQGSIIIEKNDIQKKDVFVEGVVFNIVIPFQVTDKGSPNVSI